MNHKRYVIKGLGLSLLGLIVGISLAAGNQVQASSLPDAKTNPYIVEVRVALGNDDVTQGASGSLDFDASILTMGDDGSEPKHTGLRFESLAVPPGSQIVDAWLTFTAIGVSSGDVTLSIVGHAVGNSPAFAPGDGPLERAVDFTSAVVTWNPDPWEDAVLYNSPDLSAILQEIVDSDDWNDENAITLFILDDGEVDGARREAASRNLAFKLSPKLTVQYLESLELDPINIIPDPVPPLEPPPGFEPAWVYPADYRIHYFYIDREFEPLSLGLPPADYDLDWYQPYLWYDLTIDSPGESLGEGQADWVAGQTVVRNLEGTMYAVGAEGKFYYYQMDNAAPMCFAYGLLAFIPENLSGDDNPANDWALATIGEEGAFDRDIRFTEDGPSVRYEGAGNAHYGGIIPPGSGSICCDLDSGTPGYPEPDDYDQPYLRVNVESEALGSCPPLLSETEPVYIPGGGWVEPEPDRYHVYIQVYRNSEVIVPWTLIANEVNPAITLPEQLENRDILCVDISLDPPLAGRDHGFILETDETNNRTLLVYQWTTDWFFGNEFQTILEISHPSPSFSCPDIVFSVTDWLKDQGTSSAPFLGPVVGILVLGFVGGVAGRFFTRRSPRKPVKIVSLVSGILVGVILGGLGGLFVGSALAPQPSELPAFEFGGESVLQPVAEPVVDVSSVLELANTCSDYFKTHAEKVVNRSGEIEDLLIHIDVPADVVLPADSRFMVTVWDSVGLPLSFATNNTVISLADAGFFPAQVGSPLVWQVGLEVLAGTGGDLFLPHCLPDGLHTYNYESRQDTGPDTTSVAPTPGRLPTPTTRPVDTQGPVVSGAVASPNPAFTTSMVVISATIVDPSGVAGASVYYKVGKGGYQLAGTMKSGGADSYFLSLGSVTPAGTYTFRILAEDKLGNTNCSVGNLDACPGGTFEIIIP